MYGHVPSFSESVILFLAISQQKERERDREDSNGQRVTRSGHTLLCYHEKQLLPVTLNDLFCILSNMVAWRKNESQIIIKPVYAL